jgi:hypothetical protein
LPPENSHWLSRFEGKIRDRPSKLPAGCTALAFHTADLTCDADVDLKDFAVLSNFVVR